MTTHQTTAEHHWHMFNYLGRCIALFIGFFLFIYVVHRIDKKKICCRRREEEEQPQTGERARYRPDAGHVLIEMGAVPGYNERSISPIVGRVCQAEAQANRVTIREEPRRLPAAHQAAREEAEARRRLEKVMNALEKIEEEEGEYVELVNEVDEETDVEDEAKEKE